MDDDEQNDQNESEDDKEPGKVSLKKFFNKSSSPRSFLTTYNAIKLSDGLKLILNTSLNAKANEKGKDAEAATKINYKGKYTLSFDPEKSTKFKLKYSDGEKKNMDMSVKYKVKNYSVYCAVNTDQKLITELSAGKKFNDDKIQVRAEPKIEIEKGRISWLLNSKLSYIFPKYNGLGGKLTLMLKKLTPEISLNTSYNLQEYHSKFYLDTKFSKQAAYYLDSIKFQIQHRHLTCMLQHQKSSTFWVHYQWAPHSVSAKFKYPLGENWFQVALNRRYSSNNYMQLSFDKKRWAFVFKSKLNSHTNFEFKFFNHYQKDILNKLRNSIEVGLRFNE